jgi:CDP-glycerol glycerophosphotransferase (TagB/SpsB family)
MLHARSGGETFGLAVSEFSMENKPVITYELSGERCHIELLGKRGIYYKGYEDLYDIVNNLKSYIKHNDYTESYKNNSPEKIMERFKKLIS